MEKNNVQFESLKEAIKICRSKPILFVEKVLGVNNLTKYQREAFEVMMNPDNHKVIIISSNSMGKTFLLAIVAMCQYYLWGPLTGVDTAPTYGLVKTQFHAELKNLYDKIKFPKASLTTQTRLYDKKDAKWAIEGFSPKIESNNDIGRFRGFHAGEEGTTAIYFNEGVGIDRQLYLASEQMTTGERSYWYIVANPTDVGSPAFGCWNDPSWTKVKWDCFDSPNLISNGITDIEGLRTEADKVRSMADEDKNLYYKEYKTPFPSLLTLRWVIEHLIKWGEDSFLFQSLAMASWQEQGTDNLISYKRVRECMGYEGDVEEEGLCKYNNDATVYGGCDVARFGDDTTVQYELEGNRFHYQKQWSKKDTVFVAGEIKQRIKEALKGNRKVLYGIDISGGLGAGPYDQVHRDADCQSALITLIGIEFGSSPADEEVYFNKISEMWAIAKDDFNKAEGFILEKNDELCDELTSRKYEYVIKGEHTLFRIEPKDDYKKRSGKSPDRADAFVMANYIRHKLTAQQPKSYGEIKNPIKNAREVAHQERKW